MLKIAPCYLVALSTRVDGGREYHRTEIQAPAVDLTGTERAAWETRRTVYDAAEYKAAEEVRGKGRALIRGVCAITPFGLTCEVERKALLDQRMAEAVALADAFNAGAKHCRVKFTALCGKVAESSAEAVAAVRQEIGALLAQLQAATEAGDVESIRDVARRATQASRLLEQNTEARGSLKAAIETARGVARKIVQKVEKDAEDIGAVLGAMNLSPIAAARMIFDPEEEPAADAAELMQAVAGPAEEFEEVIA